MTKNKKIRISIILMLLILLVIPYISINLSHPYDFMGLMVLLFFIINPLTTIGINIIHHQ